MLCQRELLGDLFEIVLLVQWLRRPYKVAQSLHTHQNILAVSASDGIFRVCTVRMVKKTNKVFGLKNSVDFINPGDQFLRCDGIAVTSDQDQYVTVIPRSANFSYGIRSEE